MCYSFIHTVGRVLYIHDTITWYHILVPRQLIEETQEKQRALIVNFAFKKTLWIGVLWGSMKDFERLWSSWEEIRWMRCLYGWFQCAVLHEGSYSRFFLVETGAKQKCLLSGQLFVIIDCLMHNRKGHRNCVGSWRNFWRPGWRGWFSINIMVPELTWLLQLRNQLISDFFLCRK